MFYFPLLLTLLYLQFMLSNNLEYNTISVSYANEFPHNSDQLFYMQFSPRIGEFPIYSVLIFIIRNGVDILEKGYFYPGFCFELEYPFVGSYLESLVAKVLSNHSINIRIKFTEKANFKHFEIRYGEYVSKEKMQFAKDNYLLYTGVRYSKTIHLYIRTHLEMKTLTMDGRTDGLLIDEPGFLYCKGSRGYPEHRVEIAGQHQYEVLESDFDPVTNTHKIKAIFKLYNHKSKFQCFTKDSQAELEINVFHHTTILHLEPGYYNTVPNGSNVQCVAENGYPNPKIQWYFVNGPFNYDWYFNIYENQLFILSNAPIDSSWTFNCVAENVIPNSRANSTNLLFKFSIVHSSSSLLIIATASGGAAIIVMSIIVALIIIFHTRHPKKQTPTTTRQTVVCKELAFDPDTAGSLRLSTSTECLPDELPKYEDTDIEKKFQESKMIPKDNSNTCYV